MRGFEKQTPEVSSTCGTRKRSRGPHRAIAPAIRVAQAQKGRMRFDLGVTSLCLQFRPCGRRVLSALVRFSSLPLLTWSLRWTEMAKKSTEGARVSKMIRIESVLQRTVLDRNLEVQEVHRSSCIGGDLDARVLRIEVTLRSLEKKLDCVATRRVYLSSWKRSQRLGCLAAVWRETFSHSPRKEFSEYYSVLLNPENIVRF